MKLLIYDAEIQNAIPSRGQAPAQGVVYCQGWGDFEGMGVSVICAYQWEQGYRVFLEDNRHAFKDLAEDPDTLCVGFNNRVFDDRLLTRTLGIRIPPERSYDLLRAIRAARGDTPDAVSGPSLDELCKANFLPGKAGNSAFAPLLWQKGKVGQVVDHCLRDVLMTVKLIELVNAGRLRDPENGKILNVSPPHQVVI